MPAGLSWRKVFLLIMTSSHQGLCQSCFVALSNPGASYFIKTLASTVFLCVPIGYSLLTIVTLMGVKDMDKTIPFLCGIAPVPRRLAPHASASRAADLHRPTVRTSRVG